MRCSANGLPAFGASRISVRSHAAQRSPAPVQEGSRPGRNNEPARSTRTDRQPTRVFCTISRPVLDVGLIVAAHQMRLEPRSPLASKAAVIVRDPHDVRCAHRQRTVRCQKKVMPHLRCGRKVASPTPRAQAAAGGHDVTSPGCIFTVQPVSYKYGLPASSPTSGRRPDGPTRGIEIFTCSISYRPPAVSRHRCPAR